MVSGLYSTIQKSVILTINQPQFEADLPPLSDKAWSRLVDPHACSHDENERLEFLGDALMYATIGRILYSQIPDGNPNLYTNVRAALHSNTTFSHLAERSDILAVSSSVLRALTRRHFGEGAAAPMLKSKPQIKATADLFETVIGAYYLERGFEALCDWVKTIYMPLIAAAKKAFDECQAVQGCRKRPRNGGEYQSADLTTSTGKRPRLSSSSASRKLPRVSYDIHVAKREQDSTDVTAQKSRMTVDPVTRLTTPQLRTSISRAKRRRAIPVVRSARKPIFIDLTSTSDSSDLERSPPSKLPEARVIRPLPSRLARALSVQKPDLQSRLSNPRPHLSVPESDNEDSEEDESMNLVTAQSGSDMELG